MKARRFLFGLCFILLLQGAHAQKWAHLDAYTINAKLGTFSINGGYPYRDHTNRISFGLEGKISYKKVVYALGYTLLTGEARSWDYDMYANRKYSTVRTEHHLFNFSMGQQYIQKKLVYDWQIGILSSQATYFDTANISTISSWGVPLEFGFTYHPNSQWGFGFDTMIVPGWGRDDFLLFATSLTISKGFTKLKSRPKQTTSRYP